MYFGFWSADEGDGKVGMEGERQLATKHSLEGPDGDEPGAKRPRGDLSQKATGVQPLRLMDLS